DTELAQDLVAEPGLVDQLEVRVLGLVVRGPRGDKVALERGDPVLAEEGRTVAVPQIPEEVEAACGLSLCRTQHGLADAVAQRPAATRLTIELERQELAAAVEGHAAVEDQAAVAHEVHRAVANQVLHVLAELLAGQERAPEPIHAAPFLAREL